VSVTLAFDSETVFAKQGSGNQVTKAADVTMSQASSAQREPSMEEILASIRRIIEESDTAAGKQAAADAGAAQDHAANEPSARRPEGAVIEVDAFRTELRGRAAAAPAGVAVEDEAGDGHGPVSLADVHASMLDMRSSAGSDPDIEAAMIDPIKAALEGDSLTRSQDADAEAAEPSDPSGVGVAAPETSHAGAYEAGEPFDQPSAAAVAPEPRQAEQYARPALISEQPSRQVAAAFGELSEAFSASRRKSFDEMAEEMLRPMLQDWLDNNLPTLVERLVREEIERVARGAAR
jgi:cell pole-organizing protein PopZ